MQSLAAELEIGRATLYRRIGDRDRLLAELVWEFTAPFLIRTADSSRSGSGVDRVCSVLTFLGNDLLLLPPVRAFLTREPIAALRIMTNDGTPFVTSLTTFVTLLLQREQDAGRLDLRDGFSTERVGGDLVRQTIGFFVDVVTDQMPRTSQTTDIVRVYFAGVLR